MLRASSCLCTWGLDGVLGTEPAGRVQGHSVPAGPCRGGSNVLSERGGTGCSGLNQHGRTASRAGRLSPQGAKGQDRPVTLVLFFRAPRASGVLLVTPRPGDSHVLLSLFGAGTGPLGPVQGPHPAGPTLIPSPVLGKAPASSPFSGPGSRLPRPGAQRPLWWERAAAADFPFTNSQSQKLSLKFK